MAGVFLSLGSNLGDRLANMREGLFRLRESVEVELVSSLYETEPLGTLQQPWFLNAVAAGSTRLGPLALLREAKLIERDLGRPLNTGAGPRPIDIDLLMYDRLVLRTDELTLPHPRWRERRFVLVPLVEIAPTAVDPETGLSTQSYLASLRSGQLVRPFAPRDSRAGKREGWWL